MSDIKWIIVLGVEEYQDSLNELFQKSGIEVFSEVQVKGFRFTQSQLESQDLPPHPGDPVYSVACFALVQQDQAQVFLDKIRQFNQSHQRARPLHAFQVNVEAMV